MDLAPSASLLACLQQRRQRLAQHFEGPVVLWSGQAPASNFPANRFPFRASSHFLYFAGFPLEGAAVRLWAGQLELYVDEAPPEEALWHGEMPGREALAQAMGAVSAHPLAELPQRAQGAATVAVQDPVTHQHQASALARPVPSAPAAEGPDRQLAEAIVALRLRHDAAAIAELREAAAVAVEAHEAGMAATPSATTEAQVRAAMEGAILGRDMRCPYRSVVTVHGHVLHNNRYRNPLQAGDLLLADVGAETPRGWASDVTRTWPVSGRFSPTQRALYELVLHARNACLERVAPGVEYRDLHLHAATTLAQGLVDLGILRGRAEDLVAQDAHALFFPHGVGHLVGLDVHDMEDLGDLAGYAAGRQRSDRFGLGFLRLDRPLQAGMAVTIEPGFYQVPAILNDPERRERYRDAVNWERLQQFRDVRGIRIEDDVLVTEAGCEVLTAELPAQPDAIEARLAAAR